MTTFCLFLRCTVAKRSFLLVVAFAWLSIVHYTPWRRDWNPDNPYTVQSKRNRMEQIHNFHVSYGVKRSGRDYLGIAWLGSRHSINSGNMAMQKVLWPVLESTASLAIAKFYRSSGWSDLSSWLLLPLCLPFRILTVSPFDECWRENVTMTGSLYLEYLNHCGPLPSPYSPNTTTVDFLL